MTESTSISEARFRILVGGRLAGGVGERSAEAKEGPGRGDAGEPPLAAISSSIVRADALSIRNHAASLAFQLSHGII